MSLLGSIHLANNALLATQIGIQVTGQNIANVNTPGYSREELLLTPAPTQRIGDLNLGLGVSVQGIIQKVDRFLEERLRGASSDRASSQAQRQAYSELESVIGELTDTDLSSSLNRFFSSIHEVLNQPESVATRNLVVLQGRNLTQDIVRLAERVSSLRASYNQQVVGAAADINRLTESIRDLNVRIANTEAGDISRSDAVGLRDQRSSALAQLAELVNIRVVEQESGAVNVHVGSDFLVFGGLARQVRARTVSVDGLPSATIELVDTQAPLEATSGRLAGAIAARDDVLGAFGQRLDELARTLSFEFNKLFTSGQGLTGYQNLTSEFAVADATTALDAAGLSFTPVHGSFQVQVHDRRTGQTTTTDIQVSLNGLADDTTLTSLAAQLDGVAGISASVTPTRKLSLRSESPDLEFAFADDTSGALAALGLATFFTGTSARNLGINQAQVDDPSRFAASRDGIGSSTGNALELAGFLDRSLETAGGQSLAILHGRLVGEVTQASSAAGSAFDGLQSFEQTLLNQHLAISGVNLDEEAVRLITYQRAYQAAARFASVVNELMELLVNL
jgi:flagellar hook-associated protein 1 FlgK